MVAIPAKHSGINRVVVEAHTDPCVQFVYLTIETDDGDDDSPPEPVRLCLEGIEAVDDMIDKLVTVRNRVWPFPAYTVPA